MRTIDNVREEIVKWAIRLYWSFSVFPVFHRLRSFLLSNFGTTRTLGQFYWKTQSATWQKKGPPIRPSQDDRKNYQALLSKIEKPARILLLGSTPELRDSIAEYYPSADVYIVDFSEEMYSAMTKELVRADPKHEVWVRQDWMNLALPLNSFDIVVGDVVLSQYSLAEEKNILKKIASMLVARGYFISRIHIISESLPDIDTIFRNAIAQYEETNLDSHVLALLWHLKYFLAERESRYVSYEKISAVLLNGIQSFNLHPLFVATLKKLNSQEEKFPFKWKWALFTEDEFSEYVSKYFQINEKMVSRDYHDASCYPIFLLQKK